MPKFKDSPQIYEVMAQFRDRCLVGSGSLLWDDADIWTTANLERVKNRFIDAPEIGPESFWQKVDRQFEGLPAPCYKILADTCIIYSLPSAYMRVETKWGFVETVTKMIGVNPPDSAPMREALSQGFTRTTLRYHMKVFQFWLIISFALKIKQKGVSVLEEPWKTAALADDCLSEFLEQDRAYDMRHALLHMLFPNEFERIISTEHKRHIVTAFLGAERPSLQAIHEKGGPGEKSRVNFVALDRDVALARQKMAERLHVEDPDEDPDFYSPKVVSLWKAVAPEDPCDKTEDDDGGGLLTYGRLQELVSPLKETGQIILYGPPGTGKTYYAMKLAETLIASENLDAELISLTQEDRDLMKSGSDQEIGAWWVVANPQQWAWNSIKPGQEIDFRYGSIRRHFDEIQIGDLVIGYEASPTRAVRALGRISETLQEKPGGRFISIQMTHLLKEPLPYSAVVDHVVLRESEPVRMSNRGTLFRLGKGDAKALFGMLNDIEPSLKVRLGNDMKQPFVASTRVDGELDVPYLCLCTFHPAYGYEDFIEGFRPDLNSEGQACFTLRDGIFKRICNDARQQPDKTFVLIIDEINRGNIPRIFGELITLIERDKRWKPGTPKRFSAVLPISQETFAVPENVYIIGTMNTADKSIAVLDAALGRRFARKELLPDPDVLSNVVVAGIALDRLLIELNRRIAEHIDRNAQIGHAYFMDGSEPIKSPRKLASALKDRVFPHLQDCCNDDYSVLVQILSDRIVDPVLQTFRLEVVAAGEDDALLAAVVSLLPVE